MGTAAILVFNFGGQYCHLIGRRVRDSGVYSEIAPSDLSLEQLNSLSGRLDIKGIILSGGPASTYEENAPQLDASIVQSGIPILGICYGHQLLARFFGGNVIRSERKEYGKSHVRIIRPEGVLDGLSRRETVWMSHGDTVLSLPEGMEVLAHTDSCSVAAFRHKAKPIFGVQWHPEVAHTRNGERMLGNFVFGICKAERSWDVKKNIERYVEGIKEATKGGSAIMALSGGIDSCTAAALCAKAMGSRLTAVFVDNGLMRENETEEIREAAKRLGMRLVVVDAAGAFMSALNGVSDPEEKRKVIGREFVRTFERAARSIGADYLVQGTIYPDRIESGRSEGSDIIKTHHNVGGLPPDIKFKGVVEPLRDLYKDEVRKLAPELGIPGDIVRRQPFPGPGLAVRIVGAISAEKLQLLRKADAIVAEEVDRSRMKDKLWQYFAVLTNARSTGVKGDARAYGSVIAIRAVESSEAMTANFARMPYSLLERISARLTGEIPEVVRVVYDITDKPPATIEWE